MRRINADDATAASHTAQAVAGRPPLSSAAAGSQRSTTADAEPPLGGTSNGQSARQISKPAPAVTVKPKAPQVMVRAKRKADDAANGDGPTDKKQHQDDSNGNAEASTGGLVGLAAYGSQSSGSDSGS